MGRISRRRERSQGNLMADTAGAISIDLSLSGATEAVAGLQRIAQTVQGIGVGAVGGVLAGSGATSSLAGMGSILAAMRALPPQAAIAATAVVGITAALSALAVTAL